MVVEEWRVLLVVLDDWKVYLFQVKTEDWIVRLVFEDWILWLVFEDWRVWLVFKDWILRLVFEDWRGPSKGQSCLWLGWARVERCDHQSCHSGDHSDRFLQFTKLPAKPFATLKAHFRDLYLWLFYISIKMSGYPDQYLETTQLEGNIQIGTNFLWFWLFLHCCRNFFSKEFAHFSSDF